MGFLFRSPKPPAPDPELEASRKRREEEARAKRVAQAKERAGATQARLEKRGRLFGSYRGFEDEETLG